MLDNTFKIAVSALALTLGATGAMAQDVPSWCGPNESSLALLDGFGGNSWRLVTTASGKEEVAKCPSITQFEYADGQGDTQKAISDINSMVARGIKALVVFGDAGPAVLPALTNAYRAGAIVVPYRVNVGGEAGKNYTKFIGSSFKEDGVNWGNWIKAQLPEGGNLLFISGPAGNSQGVDELAGMKEVLDDSYVFINPRPLCRHQLGPVADAAGPVGRNRQERQDRHDRIRLRPVPRRRAAGVQGIQSLDPGDCDV